MTTPPPHMRLIVENLNEHRILRDRISTIRAVLGREVALTIEFAGLTVTLPADPGFRAASGQTGAPITLPCPEDAQPGTAAAPAPDPVPLP